MNEILMRMVEVIFFVTLFVVTILLIGFLIRIGWNFAENRTKKVCDLCFRDIKKINEQFNKSR